MSQLVATSPTSSRTSSSDGTKSFKEENTAASLRRSWRSFASSLIVAARSAEKLASIRPPPNHEVPPPPEVQDAQTQMKSSVAMILKQRQSLRRAATLVEGRLRGNTKESEALHCCLRSRSCVVGRKRKFTLTNDDVKQPPAPTTN